MEGVPGVVAVRDPEIIQRVQQKCKAFCKWNWYVPKMAPYCTFTLYPVRAVALFSATVRIECRMMEMNLQYAITLKITIIGIN